MNYYYYYYFLDNEQVGEFNLKTSCANLRNYTMISTVVQKSM